MFGVGIKKGTRPEKVHSKFHKNMKSMSRLGQISRAQRKLQVTMF